MLKFYQNSEYNIDYQITKDRYLLEEYDNMRTFNNLNEINLFLLYY